MMEPEGVEFAGGLSVRDRIDCESYIAGQVLGHVFKGVYQGVAEVYEAHMPCHGSNGFQRARRK